MTTTARLTTALAAPYRVDRELGAGGMATVYLARDLKRDRDVAIKVLYPTLARSLAGERFLREIGITARLNHPHVLPLLDSGVADDGDILHDVVHRDVKPDNVMLSGGHAIVADFGIAKTVGHARTDSTLTSEGMSLGMSLGTSAYMAPEQATGDGTIDHRADVYAVGALLFTCRDEMLRGECSPDSQL